MFFGSVHLCILAGADNRYAYLRDTVHLSRQYFAAIHLIDTGSTDGTESLGRIEKVCYRRLAGWRDDWPQAYSEATRDIPYGDWFLFLDSDERPSQHLLDCLADDLQQLENEQQNCAYLPAMLHLGGRPFSLETHDPATLLAAWPATHEEYLHHPCWTKRILIKLLPTTFLGANGAHCSYAQAAEQGRYLPRFYNHYKSEHEVAVSTVLCSWSRLEAYAVPVDSPEWRRHGALRESTGLRSASAFLRAVRRGRVPSAWLEFWKTLESSRFPTLGEYWKFAFRFGFSTTIDAGFCGYSCCRYRGEQL